MKSYSNYTKTVLLAIILVASTGLASANQAPTVELEQPEGQNIATQPTFEWTGEDPEGDSLDYKLLVSVNGGNPFLSPEHTYNYNNRDPGQKVSVSPFELENGQEYTWAVIADDGGIGESRSDEWTFTTVEQNSAPEIELEDPGDGDSITLPYTFQWSVSDPDGDDIDSNTIVIEEDGNEIKEEDVGTDEEFEADEDYLDSGDYSWHVVSEDSKGNTETSESRDFTVEDEDEKASLEIRVEDNDGRNGKEMEDARVELNNGVNRGPKYTDYRGEVDFNNLPANTDIDIEVKCYGEEENKYNVELDEGEHRDIDIYFEEDFKSDTCGEDTNEEPEAQFDIDDDHPEIEQWVNFDASDSEGEIEEYHWDFGDGDTYTDDDPEISHRYNEEGDFEVELTVEEADGDEDSRTRTVDVQEEDEGSNNKPDVDLRRPDNNQEIELPYSLRWDVSDDENDDVESTVFIADDRYDNSDVDDEYLIREQVGSSESLRLYSSDLDEGEYKWRVKAEDEHSATTWSNVRSFEVVETEDRDKSGRAYLNVKVEDEDGDAIRDAKVVADNENWFSQRTDRDGEASFELQSGSVEVTVSKDGYRTKTERISISSDKTRDLSFTLKEITERDRSEEQARLDVYVEDDDYDELEDAKVIVENGDREVRYTDSGGDARFYLDADDYDVEVKCNDEEESRSVSLSEGEREDIDIRFNEEFNSDTCGEDEDEERDDDRDDDTDDGSDRDDDENGEGLEITDISYPNSVCRGGSFSVDMRIENRGGFHELVTITGSGLGSINTGQSFALDIAETKSASIRFTNVEGSGTEEFDIRATNHESDQTTERINVRDCGPQLPDTDGGDYREESVTGVTADISPRQTVVGKAVQVKGYVDGVRGRSEVTIRANNERKATVSTQPDGYYVAYIRLDQIGDNIVKVSSGQAETQSVVEAVPTSTIRGISAPDKVFEGERYEVCTNVDSQIKPKVFLLKNGKIVDSTLDNGEVCFERTSSNVGEHEYKIKTLTYGKEGSSSTTTTEVLEVTSEVTNFPDKVATTESEEGMVKVELYNTHNDIRRYNVRLNGIQSTWLSQSEKEVILNKGERETVYFYLTPEEEGNFNPTVEVASRDATIYSEEISVYAGGTKNPRKTSFFDRLSQIFSL